MNNSFNKRKFHRIRENFYQWHSNELRKEGLQLSVRIKFLFSTKWKTNKKKKKTFIETFQSFQDEGPFALSNECEDQGQANKTLGPKFTTEDLFLVFTKILRKVFCNTFNLFYCKFILIKKSCLWLPSLKKFLAVLVRVTGCNCNGTKIEYYFFHLACLKIS